MRFFQENLWRPNAEPHPSMSMLTGPVPRTLRAPHGTSDASTSSSPSSSHRSRAVLIAPAPRKFHKGILGENREFAFRNDGAFCQTRGGLEGLEVFLEGDLRRDVMEGQMQSLVR
jgi:hypothetical protein